MMIFTDWPKFWLTLRTITIVLLCLILVSLILFPFIKKAYDFKNFKKIYYRKINRIAYDNDYFLINDLTLRNHNQEKLCSIDHIIFGEKFIYVIRDRYYRGAVSGKFEDNIWYYISNKKTKEEFENPMIQNDKRINILSRVSGLQKDFFISIVLVNDNAYINDFKKINVSKYSYLVSLKELKKLIKRIEERKVPNINQEQLAKVVEYIAELKTRTVDDENN